MVVWLLVRPHTSQARERGGGETNLAEFSCGMHVLLDALEHRAAVSQEDTARLATAALERGASDILAGWISVGHFSLPDSWLTAIRMLSVMWSRSEETGDPGV